MERKTIRERVASGYQNFRNSGEKSVGKLDIPKVMKLWKKSMQKK